ncbi:hypothetical protein [Streptococcus parauberis]|uniref:hypothetical protein n=1 Tax=Streptococcus parauberis TaxID=1348 RepID=UPI000E3003AB|nr:hypothetical protein [Streptococcus parauberis]RFE01117.1 hypothetical protein ADO06_01991 [Streptococcus parauberis]
MEKEILTFLKSQPKQKRLFRELFLYVSMRLLNPNANEDIFVTRSVTVSSKGSKKTVYTLEINGN